jgi:choline dehydrogenase
MNPGLPDEAGTIVIGGGTGGAALAGTLAARSTESVLVLEAGPDYGSLADGRWPDDVLSARAIPLSHDWGLTTTSGLDLPRARVVGGCSSHNGCTVSLGPARTTTTGPQPIPAGRPPRSSRCSAGCMRDSGSAGTGWMS